MINSKTPKGAVVERIGSNSAVFAQQLCAVVSGNFINIQPRARVWQLESLLCLDDDDRNFTCDTGDDYWQLPGARKEVAMPTSASYAVRLLEPKADFLRSNVTLQGNIPLSKEFQGESR